MCHENEEWCNLKGNWLVISKLTWGIWWILTQVLESLKNFHFNVLLLSKVYIVWAKKVQRSYLSWNRRGIQNWGEINSPFQNWHKEFDKVWPDGSKVSKVFTFSLWANYILFELKNFIQRSNLSWNWRGIQNFERNRLVVSKLA